MDTDAALLRAARKLDPDALVAIFDCYAPVIFKYTLRLCGDCAEADDIVGDVFAQLLAHFKQGKGPRDNLRAYLYQIAYHKVVDHARDRKHVTTLENGMSLHSTDSLPAQQEDRDQLDAVHAIILDQLTDDQRDVITLRFIENFSIRETAEITGKDANNVKVIQNRALNRLRRVLGSQPEAVL